MSERIAIIYGGPSFESEVSARSAQRLADDLRGRFEVRNFELAPGLLPDLENFGPSLVWPVVHGALGEDGSLFAALDSLNYPVLGSPDTSQHILWNKPLTSAIAQRAGFDVPRETLVSQRLVTVVGAKSILSGIPDAASWVVKPSQAGSTQGLNIVSARTDLAAALMEAFSYSETALIQDFVGTEDLSIALALSRGTVTTLGAVTVNATGNYDYVARQSPGRVTYTRIDVPQSVEISIQAFADSLPLSGLIRIDLRRDDQGRWLFIEADSSPSLTDTSVFRAVLGDSRDFFRDFASSQIH